MSTEVKSPLRGHTLDPAQVSWSNYKSGRKGTGRAAKYDWNSLLDGNPQILEIGTEIEDGAKFKQALYGKLKERSDANRKKHPNADPYILLAQVREQDGHEYLCFEAVYSREQLQGRHPDVDGLFESTIQRSAAMSAAFAARRQRQEQEQEEAGDEDQVEDNGEVEVAEKQVRQPVAAGPVSRSPGRVPIQSPAGKAPFRSPK